MSVYSWTPSYTPPELVDNVVDDETRAVYMTVDNNWDGVKEESSLNLLWQTLERWCRRLLGKCIISLVSQAIKTKRE